MMPPAPAPLKNTLILAEVKQWNVSTVCHWLDSVDISEAKQYFENENIDGMQLIKRGKDKIVMKCSKLKKAKKDLLSRYLDELDNEFKTQALSLNGSFARSVPAAPTQQAMNSTHNVESGDEELEEEFDDEDWDAEEVYENTEQVTTEPAAVPPIPGRSGPMPPPPRAAQAFVVQPPPPLRSTTTKMSTQNGDDDENYEEPDLPSTGAAPVPPRAAAPASRPAPPQPPADDEYYEAAVIKQDDETYEATEDYVATPSPIKPCSVPPTSARAVPPPPHSGPSRPAVAAPAINPQLPPRGGQSAQPPLPSRNNQPALPPGRGVPQLPAREAPQITSADDETYEVAQDSPPVTLKSRVPCPPAVYSIGPPSVTSRSVPAVPAAEDAAEDEDTYLAPDTPPTPARHIPAPATPPVPPGAKQNTAGVPPSLPNRGGRTAPRVPVVEELCEAITDASDQLCYEATEDYEEKNVPAKKAGTSAPPLPPPGRHVSPPVHLEEVYEEAPDEEIYEETDDDKVKQPALPGRSVPLPPRSGQPQAATPPVLPGRGRAVPVPVPAVPDPDTYEATDEPSEYADPDSLVIPPRGAPPLPSGRQQRPSASDEESASSQACPPRKPASLPDARLPVAETGRSGKPIPVSGAMTAFAGSDTIKVMKNRLRPVAPKTFPSDTAPGSPPCRPDDSQPTAPGGPLAFKLKPVTPREPQTKTPTSHENEAATVVLKSPTTVTSPKSPPPAVIPKTRQQPLSPVIANNNRPPERGMLHKIDPLNIFGWYFGSINREDAMHKIQNMRREGAFLVRKSEKDPEFPYTLTVYHNNEVFNIQLRERFEDKKFALGRKKEKEHVHSTIEDLIKFHANNEIEVTKLTGPCGGVKLTVNPPK